MGQVGAATDSLPGACCRLPEIECGVQGGERGPHAQRQPSGLFLGGPARPHLTNFWYTDSVCHKEALPCVSY